MGSIRYKKTKVCFIVHSFKYLCVCNYTRRVTNRLTVTHIDLKFDRLLKKKTQKKQETINNVKNFLLYQKLNIFCLLLWHTVFYKISFRSLWHLKKMVVGEENDSVPVTVKDKNVFLLQ